MFTRKVFLISQSFPGGKDHADGEAGYPSGIFVASEGQMGDTCGERYCYWRKSTYSGGSGGNCVEVANAPGLVAVRDTTQQGAGPVLRITAEAWTTFTSALR